MSNKEQTVEEMVEELCNGYTQSGFLDLACELSDGFMKEVVVLIKAAEFRGVEKERERILKVLENETLLGMWCHCAPTIKDIVNKSK